MPNGRLFIQSFQLVISLADHLLGVQCSQEDNNMEMEILCLHLER